MKRLTAREVIDLLDLEPLKGEGGYFKFVHACLDAEGTRSAGTIWYLVTPDSYSSLHWLPTDEVWYHCLGDPLDQLLLAPDGTHRRRRLGSDLAAGERPVSIVPGRYWQGTKLTGFSHGMPGDVMADGMSAVECDDHQRFGYALCCTMMSPPYDETTYRQGDIDLLLQYPSCPMIRDFLG